MHDENKLSLESEKRYFTRYFRLSTVGIILAVTLSIILFISLDRWRVFHEEATLVQKQFDENSRTAVKNRIEQVHQFYDYQVSSQTQEARKLLQNAVHNINTAMTNGYTKFKGSVSRDLYLARTATDLRDLDQLNIADIDDDNKFFIINTDGTSILEPNAPKLEGTNLLENPTYAPLVTYYLNTLKAHPEGVYVTGYIHEGVSSTDALVYIMYNTALDVIVGTHVDIHDIMYAVKHAMIEGLRNVFFQYDRELIVADTATMQILVHAHEAAVGRNINDFPELTGSFTRVMQALKEGKHFGKINCIKNFETRETATKTVYVDLIAPINLVISSGFFEADHRSLVDAKVAAVKQRMFNDMLIAVMAVFIFGMVGVAVGLHFKQKISESFDYFGDRINDYQAALKHSYTIDNLTGLPNRASLIEMIKGREDIAVAIVNIDRFNQINDLYGADVGDSVIRHVALLLQQKFPEGAFRIFRLHADEFAVLMRGTDNLEETLRPRLRELIMTLRNSVEYVDALPLSIHLTAGLAQGSDRPLLHADMALKMARRKHKGSMSFLEAEDISGIYRENQHWTNKLKWAIENDRLTPYFQPIYDIKKGTIEKYECLVRMIDEDGSVIPPARFMPIATKSHLYHDITRIMIEKSIARFKGTPYAFSINITLLDILNPETSEYLCSMVEKNGVANQIILEIVETDELDESLEVSVFFRMVQELGCRIAIDDFGTGYSNFSYLQRLKPDFIKIDGSLIKGMEEDENARSIVEIIVEYARRNNVATIAEFVASVNQMGRVVALGADFAQGYYISEPKADIGEASDSFSDIDMHKPPIVPIMGL